MASTILEQILENVSRGARLPVQPSTSTPVSTRSPIPTNPAPERDHRRPSEDAEALLRVVIDEVDLRLARLVERVLTHPTLRTKPKPAPTSPIPSGALPGPLHPAGTELIDVARAARFQASEALTPVNPRRAPGTAAQARRTEEIEAQRITALENDSRRPDPTSTRTLPTTEEERSEFRADDPVLPGGAAVNIGLEWPSPEGSLGAGSPPGARPYRIDEFDEFELVKVGPDPLAEVDAAPAAKGTRERDEDGSPHSPGDDTDEVFFVPSQDLLEWNDGTSLEASAPEESRTGPLVSDSAESPYQAPGALDELPIEALIEMEPPGPGRLESGPIGIGALVPGTVPDPISDSDSDAVTRDEVPEGLAQDDFDHDTDYRDAATEGDPYHLFRPAKHSSAEPSLESSADEEQWVEDPEPDDWEQSPHVEVPPVMGSIGAKTEGAMHPPAPGEKILDQIGSGSTFVPRPNPARSNSPMDQFESIVEEIAATCATVSTRSPFHAGDSEHEPVPSSLAEIRDLLAPLQMIPELLEQQGAPHRQILEQVQNLAREVREIARAPRAAADPASPAVAAEQQQAEQRRRVAFDDIQGMIDSLS